MIPYTPYPPYTDISANVTIANFWKNAQGMGAGLPLILGDSITNQLPYDQACGQHILNLGIDGMRLHDFLADIENIMTQLQPSDVIIALGKNDCATSTTQTGNGGTYLTYWNWEQDAWWLPAYIKSVGITPVLMTIIPTESTVQPALAAYNNPTQVAQWNTYLKAVGAAQGCPVIDAWQNLQVSGYLPAGSTADGVHPTGAYQATVWAQYVLALQASRAARGQSTTNVAASFIP